MRSSFFNQDREAKYPDEIYQSAYQRRSEVETARDLLKKLDKIPPDAKSIVPKLNGLLLSYDVEQKESPNVAREALFKLDTLLKSHKKLIDEETYYGILKEFLKILYKNKDLELLFVDTLYENLKTLTGIKNLRNFELEYDSSSYGSLDVGVYILREIPRNKYQAIRSIWNGYDKLPSVILSVIFLILYDGSAMNNWLFFVKKTVIDENKERDISEFINGFNLSTFCEYVVRNKNFEEFIDFITILNERNKFSNASFVDFIDRIFSSTEDNDFSSQLASRFADKLRYLQARSLLCDLDKERAIQLFESISPCNEEYYKDAHYEIGNYYASKFSDAVEDDPQREVFREKAQQSLLIAQEHEHAESEGIAELLKNLQVNSNTSLQLSK